MQYNENFYINTRIIANNKIVLQQVSGKTYKNDTRLFVRKEPLTKTFILSDKLTGMAVVGAKTLKELENRFNEKKEQYERAVTSKSYKGLIKGFKKLLKVKELSFNDFRAITQN